MLSKSTVKTLPQLVARSYSAYRKTSPTTIVSLTNRELECLTLLSCGLAEAQIAYYLNISINTTKHYLRNCRIKLRCKNRFELIGFILGSKYSRVLPHIYQAIMQRTFQRLQSSRII